MRPHSPRSAGLPPLPAAPGAGGLRLCLAVALMLVTGCRSQPPVAPGEPIGPPAEVTLGTMDVECEALITALGLFKDCPNLDDDDRSDITAWIERAQQDFAAGKKSNPDHNAQNAIAAACRKAVASVSAANQRCHAGPKPRD